jgi:hypothetical protein
MSDRRRVPVEMGKPLTERSYFLAPDSSVTIRIGQPFTPADFPQESWCPWQVEGLGDDRVRRTIGIDHFQSIELAMQVIGSTLYNSEAYRSGRLRFAETSQDRDLGIPVFDEERHLVPPIPPRPEGHVDP